MSHLTRATLIGPGDDLGFLFESGAAVLGIAAALLIRLFEQRRPNLALDRFLRRQPCGEEPVKLPRAA